MDALAGYLDRVGVDASDLDEAIADYIIELAREGGTEEETWSILEGCYPELEESAPSREAFSKTFEQLQHPEATPDTLAKPPPTNGDPPLPGKQNGAPGGDTADGSATERGRATLGGGGSDPGVGSCREEADVDFLREMMPNVSDRGLRHVLYRVAKGSRLAAASYLADRCDAGGASSPALRALEADAEAWEQNELEDSRKAEETARKVEEGRRRDKAERDALKGDIVGRYADEAEGSLAKMVVPSLTEKKKSTRYRDGKVVTTTGAKVIVESLKPEWDGGSRGRVKTKGKRGKGFV